MKKQLPSDRDIIRVTDREEWRTWLDKNHAQKQSIWILIHKKHTGKPSIPYEDAVKEALCFGWIDSLVKRVDNDAYVQKFTPRKKGSNWSQSNKKRARKLVTLGRMTEAGLAMIADAKKDGSWTRLDAIDKLLNVPLDLTAALKASAGVSKNFRKLSPSLKKQFLWFIESAKKAETRKKRIVIAIDLVAQNKTMSHYFYRTARR